MTSHCVEPPTYALSLIIFLHCLIYLPTLINVNPEPTPLR